MSLVEVPGVMLLVEDIMVEQSSIIVMVPLVTVGTEHLGLIQLIVIQLLVILGQPEVDGGLTNTTRVVMVERDIAEMDILVIPLQEEMHLGRAEILGIIQTI